MAKAIVKSKTDKRKNQFKVAALVFTVLAIFCAGAAATVSYNKVIAHVELQGIKRYQATQCDMYAKDGVRWLECDVTKKGQ